MFQADLSEDVKENSHKFEQAAIIEVYPIDFGDILGEKYFGDAMDEKKNINSWRFRHVQTVLFLFFLPFLFCYNMMLSFCLPCA